MQTVDSAKLSSLGTRGDPIHSGLTSPEIRVNDQPSCRSSLYDIKNPFQTLHCTLNVKELREAEINAQDIVRSIVDLPVTPMTKKLGFNVDEKSTVSYRWWLKKSPTILLKNLQKRSIQRTRLLFDGEKRPWAGNPEDAKYTAGQIARQYPEILAGLQMTFERCDCGCNREELMDILDRNLDSGCLVSVMFLQMMLHIAHAMAEAAGAQDISNLQGRSTAIQLSVATANFLGTIAHHGSIYWATWFRLAASAITGLPHNFSQEDDESELLRKNNGRILLWLAGSMTVVPAWIGFDSALQLEGSWSVQQVNGCVEGLQAETAVVEAQPAMDSANDLERADERLPPRVTVSGGEDRIETRIQVAFFPATDTGRLFRLTSIIQTSSALRTFDPSVIYLAARIAERPVCNHEVAEEITIHNWSFDNVVMSWNDWAIPNSDCAQISLLDNSPIKQNIALGFARKCVLQSGCCLKCLTKRAREMGRYGIYVGAKRTRNELCFR